MAEKKITKAEQYKLDRAATVEAERLEAVRLSKLTPVEQTEVDSTGVVFGKIERICQIAQKSKTELSKSLGVSRQQITNYAYTNRLAEYNPKTKMVRIIAPERVISEGLL